MTQTSPPQGAEQPALGLARYFTHGQHPFLDVTWEKRHALIEGKAGEAPVFEQRDVSVPSFWSQNATNITAQKYFAYNLDDTRREWSVKQMIGRVVETIGRYGRSNGYFVTDEEQETFEHELAHILVHQMAAFNSPVWFNIGVEGVPQQCSACFLLSVEDSLDSITDWYKDEAKIFQGGSGAGLNLSALRGSGEQLSRGGKSSGPVTFMRAADASAGTITSGGRTRRAAKLVALDIDHPDIEDFIWCKAEEEKKARALQAAGFDMNINTPEGERNWASLQYQNANNSVRLSDEFLRAVEADEDWDLIARTTGEPVKTVKARDLMRQVAEAAWQSADPGVQYDTTINRWHTCPNHSPITTSNPCFPGEMRVHTTQGLMPISELVTRGEAGENVQVYTHQATAGQNGSLPGAPADGVLASAPIAFMRNGVKDLVKLTFSNGATLRCTPNHRIWTSNRSYVPADELTGDDQVLLNNHPTDATDASWQLPVQLQETVKSFKRGEKVLHHALPTRWTESFGELLGHLVGDGCLTDQKAVWVYGDTDQASGLDRTHESLLRELIGGCSRMEMANGTVQLRVGSTSFRQLLHGLGVSQARAYDKHIPEAIFSAPQEVQNAFLRGLFGSDGCVAKTENGKASRYVGLGSTSRDLLQEAQTLLTAQGIRSRVYQTSKDKKSSFSYTRNDGTYTEYASRPNFDLRITGSDMQAFSDRIGFSASQKQAALEQLLHTTTRYKTKGVVSLVSCEPDGEAEVFNITEPLHHSYMVEGFVVANCSEYMHVDDSSCNLASLNLLKFRQEDGTFNIEAFQHATDIVFLAQEILISFADYPTEKIAKNTRAMRQIGLGYANLGAYLMASGLPYDSQEGRNVAASVTALMHCRAYEQSAKIASRMGTYDEYDANKDAQLNVLRMHRKAANALPAIELDPHLVREAKRTAKRMVDAAEEHGVRNAQATVLAPTGTISFLLDCDTTGIEPDFSLVKYKKTVGGGTMIIVNQTVPPALSRLGYSPSEVEAINTYIREHNSVIGAPHLKASHYPVFATAVGENFIAPMGHLKMMAAVQPFLSGAISKTCNLPSDSTAEDIEEVYMEAWRMGLKAVAIYRDGTKTAQPLGDGKAKAGDLDDEEENLVTSLLGDGLLRGQRRRVPDDGRAIKRRFEIHSSTMGKVSGHIIVGLFEDDTPGELFVQFGQGGSTVRGFMDLWSRVFSIALQYGVPLDELVSKIAFTQFEPSGFTNDPEIRSAKSIPDYVVRWMAARFLEEDAHMLLGINIQVQDDGDLVVATDEDHEVAPSVKVVSKTHAPREKVKPTTAGTGTCGKCGSLMVQTGKCMTCTGCGDTGGCG